MKKRIIFIGLIIISLFICSWGTKMGSIFANLNKFPESVKMYFIVEKYSEKYNIPKNIAYGIPHYETGYNGILDTNYNPKRTSKHKAYGANQLKLATAKSVADGRPITKKDLINNTDLNVELSFKLLDKLHKKYGSWHKALGAYNTGKPICNKYAKKVYNYNYKKILADGSSFAQN